MLMEYHISTISTKNHVICKSLRKIYCQLSVFKIIII